MSKTTKKFNSLCIDLPRDLSLEIYQSIASVATGSGDPHSRDFTAIAYLRDELLTKHPSLGNGNDEATRRALAIAKLREANERCGQINREGFLHDKSLSWDPDVLQTSIRSLIGNLLSGYRSSLFGQCTFSNGASMGHKLQDAAPYKKFAEQATVTPRALRAALLVRDQCAPWIRHAVHYSESYEFRLVVGNGVFTVPKNNKIDRAACKEPDANMYLQKGVGGFIRRRLRSIGIDLNDQTINQRLAKLGSIDGSLATIDLSSASDSISDRLVWEFLPPQMYAYLSKIRSPRGIVDGRMIDWHLFSTMGNGFTFELESMIFWAIVKATMTHFGNLGTIGIYGDDIICPTEIAPRVLEALSFYGFKPNQSKTFITGRFRESCGAHYFGGADCKPIYIKKPVNNLFAVCLLLNRLRGWGVVNGVSDPRLFETWKWLSERVPSILFGGSNLDADYYVVSRQEARKRCEDHPVYGRTLAHFHSSPHRLYRVPASKREFSSREESGRLITWYHNGGQIIDTTTTPRVRLVRTSEWLAVVPSFPQEDDTRELS
ncbi:replicase [Escherichia phage MS2]|uniref:RNA-directed RNA polymerase n=1 Tax=Escherichia phage MS2 TaxID=12022 RepID=J9QBU8_BPMS2|nr:replicase [Escherichia phage MS2]